LGISDLDAQLTNSSLDSSVEISRPPRQARLPVLQAEQHCTIWIKNHGWRWLSMYWSHCFVNHPSGS
jgi:hypothetical protein